jgi:phage shock protein PspC (stress-responsive transcriptional regulator)
MYTSYLIRKRLYVFKQDTEILQVSTVVAICVVHTKHHFFLCIYVIVWIFHSYKLAIKIFSVLIHAGNIILFQFSVYIFTNQMQTQSSDQILTTAMSF